jgi:hypothetical protein
MSSEMVTIKVGPDETVYRVHEAVLTHHSEYFRGALRSGMEESKTRVFTLKDIEAHTFDAFVDWLYARMLPNRIEWRTRYPSQKPNPEDMRLVALYAFADRFIVSGLKNAITVLLIECYNIFAVPSHATIIFAFEHLPSGNLVQKLILDVYFRAGNAVIYTMDKIPFEELPASFLRQVVRGYAIKAQRQLTPMKLEDYQEKVKSESNVGDGAASQKK